MSGLNPPWALCGQGAQYIGGEQPTFFNSEFMNIMIGECSKSLLTRLTHPLCCRSLWRGLMTFSFESEEFDELEV